MVGVPVRLNLKNWAQKFFLQKHWRPRKNCFAQELNEDDVIELFEKATPGSIKKATKCGMKIFQGKNLKTLFSQFKEPC